MAKTKQTSRSHKAIIDIANKHLEELDRQRKEAYNQVITNELNELVKKNRILCYSQQKREFLVKSTGDSNWPAGFELFGTVGGKRPPSVTQVDEARVETFNAQTQTEIEGEVQAVEIGDVREEGVREEEERVEGEELRKEEELKME